MDDIYDAKFHGERHQSYRVIHGEQSFSGAKKFIVTISSQSTCEFEYSQQQMQVLQTSALDSKLPYSYNDQEEFIKFQSANMHHIETNELCGNRGKCYFVQYELLNRAKFPLAGDGCLLMQWKW